MAISVDNYLRLLPELQQAPAHAVNMWYDPEGDVLYINFEKGTPADDGDEVARDVIAHYKDDRIIGYTILNASLHGVAG